MKYFYTIKNDTPEHNLPERCIMNLSDLKYRFQTFGLFNNTYITVTQEFFEKEIEPRLFWPTEKMNFKPEYTGAFIIRSADAGDVLAYCTKEKNGMILVQPVKRCLPTHSFYSCIGSYFPKRNVRCFLTKEEWKADQEQKKAKIDKKNAQELSNWKDLRETVQAFSMATPKFKVLDVVKKTDSCSAQAGDIIHGEIPVIEVDDHGPHGKLHGIGTRTNYVEVYVNGKLDKCLSPLIFQKLFLENYRVEIANE